MLIQLPYELCERIADELEDVVALCRFRQTCRAFRLLGAPSDLKHTLPIPYSFVHTNYIERRPGQTLFMPAVGVRTSGPCQRASLQRRLALPQPPSLVRLFLASWDTYSTPDCRLPLLSTGMGSIVLLTHSGCHSSDWDRYFAWLQTHWPTRLVVHQISEHGLPWPSDCVLVLCVLDYSCGPRRSQRTAPDHLLRQVYAIEGPLPRIDVVISSTAMLSRWLDGGRLFKSELNWDRERIKDVRWILAAQGITGIPDTCHNLIQGREPAYVVAARSDPLAEVESVLALYKITRKKVRPADRGKTMFVVTPFSGIHPSVDRLEEKGLATASATRWQYVAICKFHECWWGSCKKTIGEQEDEAWWGITDCERQVHPSKLPITVVFSPDRGFVPRDANSLRDGLGRERLNGTPTEPAAYESCSLRDEPDWD